MEEVIRYVQSIQRVLEGELHRLGQKDAAQRADYFRASSGRVCEVCGGGDASFPATILHCAGNCGRSICGIMRYFCHPEGRFVWCCACYLALPPRGTVDGVEVVKSELIEREASPAAKEPVVPRGEVECSGSRVIAAAGGFTAIVCCSTRNSRAFTAGRRSSALSASLKRLGARSRGNVACRERRISRKRRSGVSWRNESWNASSGRGVSSRSRNGSRWMKRPRRGICTCA